MGEEEEIKKPEEKKVEEKKQEDAKKGQEGGGGGGGGEEKMEEEAKKPDEEKKDEEAAKEPPPPEEIVLKVYMHCEGCARKVKRSLKGFEGVEDVQTDCKTHKVIVKGKTADPLKVLDRVQRKSHRQVELLSPIPKPPSEEEKKAAEENKNVKPEEKKEEPQVITVVLKVHMHCEACAQEIQKRIQRMKGVQDAKADMKSSQVTVKGVFDPSKLVEYIYKRTGKHAVIVKIEPEKKEEEKKEGEDEKKEEKAEGEKKENKDGGEKKEGEGGGEAKPEGGGDEEAKAVAGETEEEAKVETMELKRNEFYYYPPKYQMEYVYPPQIFSDENPNACSIM